MSGTYTKLTYHFVFSTKHRRNLIRSSIAPEIYRYMGGIIRNHHGVLISIGGMEDHVHLAVLMKPVISISDFLREVKGGTSKWINEQELTELKFSWQDGYGAFSVSESQLVVLKNYIAGQAEHHREKSFKEEFLEFLHKHGIEYDERYIWD